MESFSYKAKWLRFNEAYHNLHNWMGFVFIKGILGKVLVSLEHWQFWRRLLKGYRCVLAILPLLRSAWGLPSECHLQISVLELGGIKAQVGPLSHHSAPVNHCSIFCPCDFVFSINGFHITGIIQYVAFCVLLFSLSIVLLRFIHVVEYHNIISFFLICLAFISVEFGAGREEPEIKCLCSIYHIY